MHIETGIKGDPGVSIVDATVNNSGHLIVVLSNGSQIDAGVAKGPPGADGQSAYDAACVGGYTGTPEDFYTELAQIADKVPMSLIDGTTALRPPVEVVEALPETPTAGTLYLILEDGDAT